ncbi:tRNA ligase 1 [Zancudomyces culisetae]|uniref:tRNA ligase 1 n=1 Tax=Zancudomyces culisetae TaxID=1213189 RepID=A0A1R1PIJ0_ZANCU|nr:tRNA ligase 1 [Zancudomyces culisetae]|eukprot:OMH80766.1 tRNA ligase 1 [Zancudomyces culisetae]
MIESKLGIKLTATQSSAKQEKIDSLLNELNSSPKKVVHKRKVMYEVIELDNWKFPEHLYYKKPSPLPTLARGFFTKDSGELNKNKQQKHGIEGAGKIVIRGYDKFYNIGDTGAANWEEIVRHTVGPYELTVKENGCIILISSLTVDCEGGDNTKQTYKLVVTSKNAVSGQHAEIGKQWVKRHLEEIGRSEAEFGEFLGRYNVTALFELCDDEFEEHILEYGGKTRGLYLHGINDNQVVLETWDSRIVQVVAEWFGFHVTKSYQFEQLDKLKEFTDKIGEDAELDGRAIEGFVVRCWWRDNKGGKTGEAIENGVGEAADEKEQEKSKQVAEKRYMFKIKYDEPYLMYREWREVSKKILSGAGKEKGKGKEVNMNRVKYGLTKAYIKWLKKEYQENPKQFDGYLQNQGIISARNRFLEYNKLHGQEEESSKIGSTKKSTNGNKKDKSRSEDVVEDERVKRILLMTVATIGCGKTTVSVGLNKLYGFGHVQNDNISAKKNARQAFHDAIDREYEENGKAVVIADRNNHIELLRRSLVEHVQEKEYFYPEDEVDASFKEFKVVAMYWNCSNVKEVEKQAVQRIEARGENHQSLTPKRTGNYRAVIHKFLRDFEPIIKEANKPKGGKGRGNGNGNRNGNRNGKLGGQVEEYIDEVIELDPLKSSAQNLYTVIEYLTTHYPHLLNPTEYYREALGEKAININNKNDDNRLTPELLDQNVIRNVVDTYKPTVIKNVKATGKPQKPRYFGLLVNDRNHFYSLFEQFQKSLLTKTNGNSTSNSNNGGEEEMEMEMEKEMEMEMEMEMEIEKMNVLKESINQILSNKNSSINGHNNGSKYKAIPNDYHVTLAHIGNTVAATATTKTTLNGNKNLYEEYNAKRSILEGKKVTCKATYLMVGEEAMTLQVQIEPDVSDEQDKKLYFPCINEYPHITLAFNNKAKDSNDMLQSFYSSPNNVPLSLKSTGFVKTLQGQTTKKVYGFKLPSYFKLVTTFKAFF